MDYRVKVTIRNDRLLSAIENKGFESTMQFCKTYGLQYVRVCDLIRGTLKPIGKKNEPIKIVKELLSILDIELEDAFTTRQLEGFSKSSFETKMDEKQLLQIANPVKNLEMKAIENEVKSTINDILPKYLTPKQESILRMRYGIGTDVTHTLEEISLIFKISRERARQIEIKAIEKLQKPEIMSQLINTGFSEVFTKVDLNEEHLKQQKKHLYNKIIQLKSKIYKNTGERI